MEKENKKARDDARKEYNETIRSLATFVRKRDPRYKSHLAHQARMNHAKANDSQRSSSSKSTPQRTQTNNTTYVEQEWQKVANDHQHDDLEWAAGEGGDPEEWECVACGKSFKSEAAWNSHERSKKHMKEVERLKKEILKENEELGLSAEGWDEEQDHVLEVDENVIPPLTRPEKTEGDDSDTLSAHHSETANV